MRAYKSLARVERAFRCLKTADLDIRPIFHRVSPRVRAHVAFYLEWHLRTLLADRATLTRNTVRCGKASAMQLLGVKL